MSSSDPTGRNRLAKNVGASFLGHIVFVVLGFVMPRMIDTHVGQAGLGVWDFSWSFVSYLGLSMVGIGSAVNRYVAKFRAAGDVENLSNLVSSVVAIQVTIAVTVLAVSIGLAKSIPLIFAARLGEFSSEAGWVIGLLGASLSVQMAFDAWRGVISGCHRWDYYNAINAGGYAAAATLMLLTLSYGGGLRDIAAAYLAMTILTELIRFWVAKTVCPEINLAPRRINRKDAKRAVSFGLKTIVLAVPSVLIVQTVYLLLVASLGPSVLAVLARPISLIQQVTTLMNKYSFILTPMAGSIQSKESLEEIRAFALKHARAGWILAVPPMTFFLVLGDVVLEIWMGPDYAIWAMTAVLSLGYMLPVSQSTVMRVLIGLDAHGPVARSGIVVAAITLSVGLIVAFNVGWSLELAAMIVAGAAGAGSGLNVLYHTVRYFNIGLSSYLFKVAREAFLVFVVLGASLWAVRVMFGAEPVWVIAIGGVVTVVVFALLQKSDLSAALHAIRSSSGSGR